MTGRALSLDLTLPPSVNAAFCNVPGKGRVRTAKYRAWQKQALAAIRAQAHGMTFRGTFRLVVLASDCGLARRRDADNLGKAIADTLTKSGVIEDDCHKHMRAICIAWTPKLPAGTCRVTVIELAAAPMQKPAAALRRAVKQGFPQIRTRARKFPPRSWQP